MSDKYINPFDKPENQFFVLVNDKNQHSLWLDFKRIPDGWTKVFGPSLKQQCIEYIDKNWLDIRS